MKYFFWSGLSTVGVLALGVFKAVETLGVEVVEVVATTLVVSLGLSISTIFWGFPSKTGANLLK